MEKSKKFNIAFSVFIILLFIFLAFGFYTFYNAKGMSYFSDASESCNNCHVMNEVYYDYTKAPHSRKIAGKPAASCNDCHLPHGAISKWLAKAESGVKHAYAFTFELDHLPINLSANEKSKTIVQNNCVSCHSEMAAHAINATTKLGGQKSLQCVSCHVGVGHKRGF